MTGRMGVFLCAALCLGAVAASSASADSTGYLCVAGGSGGEGTKYSDATCKTAAAGGAFGHGAIALNNETQLTLTKVGAANGLLKAKIGLIKVTVTVEGTVECIGCMVENHEETVGIEKGKELRSTTPLGFIRFTRAKINVPSCEVDEEEFDTNYMKIKSIDEAGALRLELTPEAEPFAKILLNPTGAGPCALGAEIDVAGLAKATTHGTIVTLATGAGELLVGGQKAELIGEVEMSAGVTGEPPHSPLALTES